MISLPQRSGERPKTHYGLQHEQLSQNPSSEMHARLKVQAFGFEFVERRQHHLGAGRRGAVAHRRRRAWLRRGVHARQRVRPRPSGV